MRSPLCNSRRSVAAADSGTVAMLFLRLNRVNRTPSFYIRAPSYGIHETHAEVCPITPPERRSNRQGVPLLVSELPRAACALLRGLHSRRSLNVDDRPTPRSFPHPGTGRGVSLLQDHVRGAGAGPV